MITDEELYAFYYVDESPIHGKGLYAAVEISKGEYMGEYDGPSVTENGSHVLWAENESGEWEARDGKNLLRYLNHTDEDPHAEFHGFELFAIRDIKVGEEVMIDYGEHPVDD